MPPSRIGEVLWRSVESLVPDPVAIAALAMAQGAVLQKQAPAALTRRG
jgi:hypothetical protein